MDVELILKIGGIGMIVAVINHALAKVGRDDVANFVSLSGVIIALAILLGEIGDLISSVMEIFGI